VWLLSGYVISIDLAIADTRGAIRYQIYINILWCFKNRFDELYFSYFTTLRQTTTVARLFINS